MAKTWKTILIYHIMDEEMRRCAKSYLRGKLLDIGCGTKPYKRILSPHVTEHVGLDQPKPFNAAAEVDLIGTAYNIPAKDASFDSAISTAALDRKSTRLNSSHQIISYAVFCLKKKKQHQLH